MYKYAEREKLGFIFTKENSFFFYMATLRYLNYSIR